MSDIIVDLKSISKVYPLYDHPTDRIKEALHPFRKKYHRNFFALKDVSLNIRRGECVALIGMNGSGKSTLLQIIAGVVRATSGSCSVKGRLAALLELGSGFNPEMTGLENARFQCSLMGVPDANIKRVLQEIRDFADIGDFFLQPVKTYSSGMYVRLAFAAAISVDPDILIVDEALAVGDAYFQTKSLSRIKKFRESGKTLIFVSHDPAVVKNICDRAYLLSHGAIINEGHPEAIFNEYNQFIASMSAKSSRNNLPKAVAEPMQRLQIHDLRLRGENGIYTDTIVSGERCTFEVEFSSDQPSFDPIISLSIRDRMGIEIFGISNADLSTRFGAVQAKKIYRARFELKLKLGQNTYTVEAKAQTSRSASPESIAVNHSPFAFRVLLSPNNKFVGSCALDTSISFNQFDGTTL